MKSTLLSLALLLFALAYIWPGNVTKYPPGVLVAGEPDQSMVSNGKTWDVKGYTLKSLADYWLRARVLMTERYFFGRESDLSPLDFSVGGRRMSDQQVLDQISFTRERRAYCYRPKVATSPSRSPRSIRKAPTST